MATTADFEALAEELSGQELTPMFDAWLRDEGLPDYDEWVPVSAGRARRSRWGGIAWPA